MDLISTIEETQKKSDVSGIFSASEIVLSIDMSQSWPRGE